ncbi:hypothetical protein OSI96_20295, partial [Mycobacterium ulcerans]
PPPARKPQDHCGSRDAMMPKRARTRAQSSAARIATERNHNMTSREARRRRWEECYFGPRDASASDDEEPPPF